MGPFLSKSGKKWISHKNWAASLFKIYSPVTSCKKIESMSEIREKLLPEEQTKTNKIIEIYMETDWSSKAGCATPVETRLIVY